MRGNARRHAGPSQNSCLASSHVPSSRTNEEHAPAAAAVASVLSSSVQTNAGDARSEIRATTLSLSSPLAQFTVWMLA